jgi:hypothetical protein
MFEPYANAAIVPVRPSLEIQSVARLPVQTYCVIAGRYIAP